MAHGIGQRIVNEITMNKARRRAVVLSTKKPVFLGTMVLVLLGWSRCCNLNWGMLIADLVGKAVSPTYIGSLNFSKSNFSSMISIRGVEMTGAGYDSTFGTK